MNPTLFLPNSIEHTPADLERGVDDPVVLEALLRRQPLPRVDLRFGYFFAQHPYSIFLYNSYLIQAILFRPGIIIPGMNQIAIR